MRGKVRDAKLEVAYNRITPAYAGKSVFGHVGEGAAVGSPPRMRGKAEKVRGDFFGKRITPAYAGKRASEQHRRKKAGDHPRVCGEKFFFMFRLTPDTGSPPRMRGKAAGVNHENEKERITPAYAGKRRHLHHAICVPADHPRVCGEKEALVVLVVCARGSPPRMRGKDRVFEAQTYDKGITPAYAGKRLKRSRSTVPPVAIVPLFPSVCNKPVVSDGSPAGRDAPLFLPAENAVPASPAYNLRSL